MSMTMPDADAPMPMPDDGAWCPQTKIFSLLQRQLCPQPTQFHVRDMIADLFALDLPSTPTPTPTPTPTTTTTPSHSRAPGLSRAVDLICPGLNALGKTVAMWLEKKTKTIISAVSAWLIWLWQIFGPVQWATSNPNSCDKLILNATSQDASTNRIVFAAFRELRKKGIILP